MQSHPKKKFDSQHLADLGFLTASLAHEIKNPLAALQLSVQTVQRLLQESQAPTAVVEQLKVMEKSIRRVNRLAHKMIDLGKGKKGRSQEFSLEDTVRETLALYSYLFVLNEIEVEEEIGPGIIVFANPDQMTQALVNLLNNSVNALKQKERDRRLRVKTTVNAGMIHLEVWNNGPEFAPETQFGLGLTIAEKIVREHGGEIRFTSTATGTCFQLSFPEKTLAESA